MSGPNAPYTNLDSRQVTQQVFDEASDTFRIRVLGGGGLITVPYDYLSVAYPTTTQEVYSFKVGGSGGTLVNTVTINYVDSTKNQISTVIKT